MRNQIKRMERLLAVLLILALLLGELSPTFVVRAQGFSEDSQTNGETSQTTDPVINPQQTTQNNEICP